MIRKEYISFSAGALVIGSLCLVLGFALNPLPQGEPMSAATLRPEDMSGRWLASSMALFAAAVGLTLGIASLLSLMRRRDQALRVLVPIVLACGTVGLAGYSTVMIFMRGLVFRGQVSPEHFEQATTDGGVRILGVVILGGFMVGTLLVAWGLQRAGTTPRWVPAMLWAYLASQFLPIPGASFTVVQFAALAVGLTGAALAAAESAYARDEVSSSQQSQPAGRAAPLTSF